MKNIDMHYICSLILFKSYNKSDIKSIKAFTLTLPTHYDVDATRTRLSMDIDALLEKLSNCSSEHQLCTALRHQSIPIKFFMFERIQVLLNSLEDLNVKTIAVEDAATIGHSFVESLQKTWESVLRTAELDGTPVSQLSLEIFQDHY